MFKRIAVLLGVLALIGFMSLPAFAAKSDNDGDADSLESTSYTEDTDTNDDQQNNVADSGDNKHPSGKDRSVEPGRSRTQGKAESNPDDSKGPMRYEGEIGDDKPNGPGGTDLEDQDGNNGCGNDDDFDDDNNGRCGKPSSSEPTVNPPARTPPAVVPGTEVLGGSFTRSPQLTEVLGVSMSKSPKPTAVLGVQLQRGQALARTGSDSVPMMMLIASALMAMGLLALELERRNAQ